MNVKWDIELKPWQYANPVIEVIPVTGVTFQFDEYKLLSVLTAKGHQLKTWGGAQSTSEPHFIGVKKQTPIHTDPRYPRWSWQLILKVDAFSLRGINKQETELKDNLLILLDTHSPHQLFALTPKAKYYLAVSIDSKERLLASEVKDRLIEFANTHDVIFNTDRITK